MPNGRGIGKTSSTPILSDTIDYEIDNDFSKCKACPTCGAIYFYTTSKGYRNNYCIECRERNLYDKLIKIDFSTDEFSRVIGPQPNGLSEKKSIKWRQAIYNLKRQLFTRYVASWPTLDENSESYKLNIETLFNGGEGHAHDAIEQRVQERIQAKKANEGNVYIPKCPTCGSINLRRISSSKRITSAVMWGVFSNEFGKSFVCNDCGYKW